jgi:hypothetical protein
VSVAAPTIAGGGPSLLTTVHAKPEIVRPQAAALPLARKETSWPDEIAAGSAIAATGRRAALTDPSALIMPAPQALVLQTHSAVCVSPGPAGTRHAGIEGSLAGR